MFKIRNTDGLYSTGNGAWPKWAKVGRSFRSREQLLSHVVEATPRPKSYFGPREHFYTDSDVVVEFAMAEVDVKSLADYKGG